MPQRRFVRRRVAARTAQLIAVRRQVRPKDTKLNKNRILQVILEMLVNLIISIKKRSRRKLLIMC